MKSGLAFQQEEIDEGAEIVCASFETHSVKETMQLGAAFAHVARLDARPEGFPHKIMRVGLKASMGSGKTPFAQGMINEFNVNEGRIVEGAYHQSVRETENAGIVRHVDAAMEMDILPAYIDGWTEDQDANGLDLIEHPLSDPRGGVYANKVDYLVNILNTSDSAYGSDRNVIILCLTEKARSKGFQEFLRATNGNVKPVSQEIKSSMPLYVMPPHVLELLR